MARARTPRTPAAAPAPAALTNPTTAQPRQVAQPVFAQPQPSPDPTKFLVQHPSDANAYKQIDALNKAHKLQAIPFPAPRGGVEPILTLTQVFNGNSKAIKNITSTNQIVFHARGDCGSTTSPETQNKVVDKMVGDFDEASPGEIPQFCLLLGDVVYSFGEVRYYYDQFYEPNRNYAAPILAVAGNHDGMLSPDDPAATLTGFLRNFCAESFVIMPEAGGLSRTAQIQPGVFFTFEAPFVRILALYSNTLEDPGVIADKVIGNSQLDYLKAALSRVKSEKYTGALLIAFHHPPYTGGSGNRHSGSPQLLAQIDSICQETGIWPHAVLAGHAHNYQRFTRTMTKGGAQIPYLVSGNGGHNPLQPLTKKGSQPLRTPLTIQTEEKGDQVVLENYDGSNYGYLRVIATATQLRIEYHTTSDDKTPDDFVTVDLKTRRLVHFTTEAAVQPKKSGRSTRKRG